MKRGDKSRSDPALVPWTGNAYVDDCFHHGLVEIPDDRDWWKIPEAVTVTELMLSPEKGLLLARKFRDENPDYYFGHLWVAWFHRVNEEPDGARLALSNGLRLSKSKAVLCVSAGDIEWYLCSNITLATQWWIRSLGLRERSEAALEPLLYLAHLAKHLHLPNKCTSSLASWAKEIDPDRELIEELKLRAMQSLYGKDTDSMKLAISLLVKHIATRR